MKTIISNILSFVLIVTLAFTSCSKSDPGGGYNTNPPPASTPAANNVNINGMSFSPASKTVKVGTTITWINNDVVPHTVTADDNSFDSGSIAAGGKFTHTFAAAGTFAYHCNFHAGMNGTVVAN